MHALGILMAAKGKIEAGPKISQKITGTTKHGEVHQNNYYVVSREFESSTIGDYYI